MTLVIHAGALEGAKQATSNHHSVLQEGGKEETADVGRGDAGERRYDLLGLRKTARDGYLLQIPGEGLDGCGGQRLSGGGMEPSEGAEELGTAGEDSGTRGRQPKGFGCVFKGGGAGGSFIWVRDVVDEPLAWGGTWEASITGLPGGSRGLI